MSEAKWTVWRHGGNSFHSWRKVFEGMKHAAIAVYSEREVAVRQGGIELRDDKGVIQERRWISIGCRSSNGNA